MKSLFVLALFQFACFLGIGQDPKFAMPLKGTAGKDFFIDYYVDHDTTGGLQDVFCGTKTYNGHKGTDFLISGYLKMDSGVYIYAAADGRVFEATDGAYDRSKHWENGGFGNHIGIIHKNEVCTYYGHMMKHSLMVKIGDSVKAGQPIGKVGSSGYSSYPHLHFEARNKNRQFIDPFWGGCSNRTTTWWIEQPSYDTSLFTIDNGFVPYIPQSDTLQERYRVTDTFYIGLDSVVCFWALIHGLHEGDNIRAEWYRPTGILKHTFSYVWKFTSWHVYTWPHIPMPDQKGAWNVKLYVNNSLLTSRHFYVRRRT